MTLLLLLLVVNWQVFTIKSNVASESKISAGMYRVAQNKIPHQTICNIFTTSGQMLKILEAV